VSRARVPFAAILIALSLGACNVERVSVSSGEEQANAESSSASISRDGRYVALQSRATNLVPNDGSDDDIFLRDRATGQTTLVTQGAPGNEASVSPEISANGRYVAFDTAAKLVPEDTQFFEDVYVWDRETGATTRASVSSTGEQANSSSVISPSSFSGIAISRDGRYVAFNSAATNLAPGDTNALQDVFVRDRVAGTTVRIAAESTGEAASQPDGSKLIGIGRPAISLDGRFVSFASARAFTVPGGLLLRESADVYVRDMQTGVTTRLSKGAERGEADFVTALDRDGAHVAFSSSANDLVPGDTNGLADVFVRNLRTGAMVRVPAETTGEPKVLRIEDPSLSRTGRFLAFTSASDPGIWVNVYVHDLDTGRSRRLSKNPNDEFGKGFNGDARISADGRFVSFLSADSTLVPNDTNDRADVFVSPARPVR
jgi:Tol biopolymer transport system component